MFSHIATITTSSATNVFRNRIALSGAIGAVRNLNVHEHISMELFNSHGINTPKGAVAFTPEEAEEAYKKMGNRAYHFIKKYMLQFRCFYI